MCLSTQIHTLLCIHSLCLHVEVIAAWQKTYNLCFHCIYYIDSVLETYYASSQGFIAMLVRY